MATNAIKLTAIMYQFSVKKCAVCGNKIVRYTAVIDNEPAYCSYGCGLTGQPEYSSTFMGTYSHEE